jgi:hypothetical protein
MSGRTAPCHEREQAYSKSALRDSAFLVFMCAFLRFTNLQLPVLISTVGTIEQWYSNFFVCVPPDIISLQRCTPRLVGV